MRKTEEKDHGVVWLDADDKTGQKRIRGGGPRKGKQNRYSTATSMCNVCVYGLYREERGGGGLRAV